MGDIGALLKKLGELPFSVLTQIVGFISRMIDGIFHVLNNGVDQNLNLHLSIFGREVGIEVHIKLLTAGPAAPAAKTP